MWPIQIPSLVFWFQVERSRRHPEPIGLLSMSNRKATRSWLSEANFYLSCIAGDESFLQHVETRIGWPISLLPLDLGDLIRWGPRLLQVGCGPWRCSGWGGLTFNGVKKRDWLVSMGFPPVCRCWNFCWFERACLEYPDIVTLWIFSFRAAPLPRGLESKFAAW